MEYGVTIRATEINPDVGDMMLDETGNVVTIEDVGRETAQRIWVCFQFFLGEYFLDLDQGMPMYERILVKGATDQIIRSVFQQAMLKVEGVESVASLTYSFDPAARHMEIFFAVVSVEGQIIRSEDYGAFIVDLNT